MSKGYWIKMRRALGMDPDVIAIAAATGLDRFSVVGRLHAVWSWCEEHDVLSDGHRDGVSVTHAFLDQVADHDGFANALRNVGWLSGTDGSLTFPNFDRHNGNKARERAQNAERNRKFRSRDGSENGPKRDGNRDATTVTNSSPKNKRRVREEEGGGNRLTPGPFLLVSRRSFRRRGTRRD